MSDLFRALLVSCAVGFVLALARVATLGPITQQFSARSLGLGKDPRASEVVDSLASHSRPKLKWSTFVRNLTDPRFWQILVVAWALTSAICFLANALLLLWLHSAA